MEKLIDIGSDPVASLLNLLLADKSTKKEHHMGDGYLRGTWPRFRGQGADR